MEKYRLELEGVLLVKKQECIVHQDSLTVIQDVGTTTIDLPDFVRDKRHAMR